MVVNPMSESAYLKGECRCIDVRDCFHRPCLALRQIRFGKVLVKNGAGYVLLAGRRELTAEETGREFRREGGRLMQPWPLHR